MTNLSNISTSTAISTTTSAAISTIATDQGTGDDDPGTNEDTDSAPPFDLPSQSVPTTPSSTPYVVIWSLKIIGIQIKKKNAVAMALIGSFSLRDTSIRVHREAINLARQNKYLKRSASG